jgi:hypothetical protein
MPPKTYTNLNPTAAIGVNRDQILHLESFFDQFRTRRDGNHGHLVPNLRYIFVKTTDDETLMHPTYRHPALASGRPVVYAGEAYFDNGRLKWWSNGSGNYRPDAEHAPQAGLPMDHFFTYSQVIRGEHQRAAWRKSAPKQPAAKTAGVQPRMPGAPLLHWPPAWGQTR